MAAEPIAPNDVREQTAIPQVPVCAHDIYAIPLCQSCQRDIERDRDNWEKTHGRLAMHQRLFFDYALGVGAITSHSSSVR
ncbi:DUF968 domain-containing protein [Escherichia coli]